MAARGRARLARVGGLGPSCSSASSILLALLAGKDFNIQFLVELRVRSEPGMGADAVPRTA